MKAFFYFVLLPALLPVLILFFYIYKNDKVEKEPFSMLLKVFIFGALFSLFDIPTENMAHSTIATWYPQTSMSFELANNFLGIALVEEITKWVVLMLFVWRSKNFNHKFDGVIYAATSSLGFAALENIIYIVSYGTGVAVGRAIFAIPGHFAFGVIMGYFFTRAKKCSLEEKGTSMLFYLLLSLAMPTLAHGTYDFLLSPVAKEAGYDAYFFILVAIIDFLAWLLIKKESESDIKFVQEKTDGNSYGINDSTSNESNTTINTTIQF